MWLGSSWLEVEGMTERLRSMSEQKSVKAKVASQFWRGWGVRGRRWEAKGEGGKGGETDMII